MSGARASGRECMQCRFWQYAITQQKCLLISPKVAAVMRLMLTHFARLDQPLGMVGTTHLRYEVWVNEVAMVLPICRESAQLGDLHRAISRTTGD